MEKPMIRNNEKQMQFEYREGDSIARLEYRFHKDNMAMMHTVVPPPLEGKGIASALVSFAFDYARTNNKKVMAYCPFVAQYVKKHPELNSQMASNL